ncbi:tripartite motif-containing protein 2-like [Saccostrea echinata]|uniref:tripartite motif-containing protein 2-like n=1 Tax=Saccostrea echinata TaxID=191078 RepID=UPI002A82BF9A|nr:tripartite motif-containing protein 2-like [Saccostrea echinata]
MAAFCNTQAQAALKTCHDHGDLLDMFCVDCEEEICLICGQQEHGSHDWSRTLKVLDRIKLELREQCNVVRQDRVPGLQAEIQKIKELRQENENLVAEKTEKILTHTETVMKNLQRICSGLVIYCKAIKVQNEEKLDAKEKEIEIYLSQFESSLKDIEEESKTIDLSKLLQLKKNVESVPDPLQLSEQDLTLHQIEFNEGKKDEKMYQSILGEIFLKYDKVTVTKIFEAKKGNRMIKYISPISDTQAWFREFRSSENVLLNIANGNAESGCMFGETQSDHIPDDFITLSNGVHIYTWHAGHSVMKISPPKANISEMSTNKVVKLADLSPLFPVGICATAEDRFLVSAIDTTAFSEDLFTKRQPKKSVVMLLSNSGKTKKVYQYDEDGKTSLFLYPYRISVNTNGDICVIDRTAIDSGQLCVLSQGKLRYRYKGNGPNQSEFDPRGISCDSASNILLSDCGNKCVHLLKENGNFLTYLIRSEEGLWSMSMFLNILWIGGKNGFIHAYRYQISDS